MICPCISSRNNTIFIAFVLLYSQYTSVLVLYLVTGKIQYIVTMTIILETKYAMWIQKSGIPVHQKITTAIVYLPHVYS
jgi:hypothetical protein